MQQTQEYVLSHTVRCPLLLGSLREHLEGARHHHSVCLGCCDLRVLRAGRTRSAVTSPVLGAVANRFFGVNLALDAAEWANARLQVHLWSDQRRIADSVRDNRYTAVKACH